MNLLAHSATQKINMVSADGSGLHNNPFLKSDG